MRSGHCQMVFVQLGDFCARGFGQQMPSLSIFIWPFATRGRWSSGPEPKNPAPNTIEWMADPGKCAVHTPEQWRWMQILLSPNSEAQRESNLSACVNEVCALPRLFRFSRAVCACVKLIIFDAPFYAQITQFHAQPFEINAS